MFLVFMPPLFSSDLVLEDDVQCVNDAWNVTQDCKPMTWSAQLSLIMRQLVRHSCCTYRMLIRRSAPQPLSINTPRGGMKIARMILMISL